MNDFIPDPSWPSIVELGIEMWGPPNEKLRKKDEVRWGNNGSKRVTPSKNLWKDEETGEGGGYIKLWRQARKDAPLPPRADGLGAKPKANGKLPWSLDVKACYPYPGDAADPRLIEVVRTSSGTPRFRQRTPDADERDGWKWQVKHIPGHDRRLYRLAELRASAADERVWICAGEKDTDRLIAAGLIAVTNIGGEAKWHPEQSEAVRDRHCIVLQDNDAKGERHVAVVAHALHGIAASVRVLLLPGLPPKGDVSDFLDAARTLDELKRLADDAPEYEPASEKDNSPTPDADDDIDFVAPVLRPINQIPTRQWAYGNFLMFGGAAVIGALDGTGKGYVAVAIMLAMITGRDDILGEKVWRKGPVAIVTYEDAIEEWERRFAAACIQHGEDFETIMQSVRFVVKRGGRVVFAQAGRDGVIFPDSDGIAHRLIAGGFVMMLIDPFNNAHALDDGNNNVAIAAVAAEMSRIALTANVVILVLHHLRKGAKGDPDDLMGALMLRANFRATRIFQKMTAEEAGQLGIPVKDAWRYIRLSGTKENYNVPADKAMWFKLESQPLGNAEGIYPQDWMGAVIPWEPPAMFEGMNAFELHAVFTAIGVKQHAKDRRATAAPWVGQPLMDVGNRTEDQAIKIVTAWTKAGVLVPGEPVKRDNRTGLPTLTTDPAKVAAILASNPAAGAAGEP
jgi:hypothetical protein